MAKYYEAESLLEFVKQNTPTIDGQTTMGCVERAIKEAPTADVVEVKHGEWIKRGLEKYGIHTPTFICSVCGKRRYTLADYNYCPNCGAKMDGGKVE